MADLREYLEPSRLRARQIVCSRWTRTQLLPIGKVELIGIPLARVQTAESVRRTSLGAPHVHRKDARAVRHPTASSDNDSAHWQSRLGIEFKRWITHFLLHFKAARARFTVLRNSFVNVRCHMSSNCSELKTLSAARLLRQFGCGWSVPPFLAGC